MESWREAPQLPGALPGVGHLPALLIDPLRFVRSARRSGEMVRLRFGPAEAYLVNDPELVHRILVSDVAAFDKGVQYDKLRALLGNGLSTAAGRPHRDRRRLMQPVFHPRRLADYRALMRQAARDLLLTWRPGDLIEVDDAMRRLSLTVVTRALCSTELSADAVDVIHRDLPTVLRGIPWRALSPIELLERLPLPANRRFAAANARLRRTVEQLVARYRRHNPATDDLLATLLRARDPDTGAGLSDEQVRDEMVNLLFAGTETTGNALAWVWQLLAADRHADARLRADIAGGSTGYAERIARETLRLYPPPWLISRRTRRPVELGGFRLPAGASVLFSPYAIQRDPVHFPEPDRFAPDRWLPDRAGALPRKAFLAFGAGPHNCIGERFALLAMTTIIETLTAEVRLLPTGPVRSKGSATLVPVSPRMRVLAEAEKMARP